MSRLRHLLVISLSLVLFVGTASAQSVSFDLSEETVSAGETATVDVAVSDFENVTSAQFTVDWNPSVASFGSVTNTNLPGLSDGNFGTPEDDEISDGTVTVSWNDPDAEGVTVSDGTVIFSLELKAIGDGGEQTSVSFADDPTQREVTVDFSVVTFDGSTGAVNIGGTNQAPKAEAGSDQSVTVGTDVELDGTGSSDPDGDDLSYSWSFASRPSGSSASLKDANTATPTFTPDASGDYDVELEVSDGNGGSDTDQVTVSANAPPVVEDDSDDTQEGQSVTTDVLANDSDPDGSLDESTVAVQSAPSNGSTSVDGSTGEITYTPDEGFTGEDSYAYTVADNEGAESTEATVTITVNEPHTVTFDLSDETVSVGETAAADLSVSGFDNVTSLQFTVEWDPSVASFASVTNINLTGLSDGNFGTPEEESISDGTLTVSWNDPDAEGVAVSDGTVLFTLELEAIGNPGDQTSVVFADDPTEREVTVDFSEVAFDGSGGAVNVEETNQAPTAEAGSDQSVTVGTEVSLDGTGSSDPDGDDLSYSWSFASQPSGSSASLTDASSATPTFTPDVAGEYTVELEISDGNGGTDTDQIIVEANSQGNIAYDISREFGGSDEPSDYRLVALPGAIDRSVAETLDGEVGTEWRVFWDDGSSENFLIPYDDSDTFTFRPGRGFWLTSRIPWTASGSVEAVELDGDQAVSIPLHEGWNIISNPLRETLAWNEVRQANEGTLQPVWAFDGSFAQVDTFPSAASGQAFYFLNNQDIDSLKVPLPGTTAPTDQTVASKGSEDGTDRADVKPSSMTVIAESGESLRSVARVGIDPDATSGLGPEDVVAPPAHFSGLSLRLRTSSDVSARKRLLAAEWHPPSQGDETGHTFMLQLQTQGAEPVRLGATGLKAMEGREVALLNPSSGQSYDLRSHQTVTLQKVDSTELRLAIGSAAYVQNQEQSIVPGEVTLSVYPNPSRAQATIEYTLPDVEDVQIIIYDVLGRRVSVVEDGRKSAGRHSVQLDGTQLSSGVYFGRLQAGKKTITRKITVLR